MTVGASPKAKAPNEIAASSVAGLRLLRSGRVTSPCTRESEKAGLRARSSAQERFKDSGPGLGAAFCYTAVLRHTPAIASVRSPEDVALVIHCISRYPSSARVNGCGRRKQGDTAITTSRRRRQQHCRTVAGPGRTVTTCGDTSVRAHAFAVAARKILWVRGCARVAEFQSRRSSVPGFGARPDKPKAQLQSAL